jgi:hypothetical protein
MEHDLEKNVYDSCCFCLDTMEKNVLTLPCNHDVHKTCFESYFNFQADNFQDTSCPLCRRLIIPYRILYFRASNLSNVSVLHQIVIFMFAFLLFTFVVGLTGLNKMRDPVDFCDNVTVCLLMFDV